VTKKGMSSRLLSLSVQDISHRNVLFFFLSTWTDYCEITSSFTGLSCYLTEKSLSSSTRLVQGEMLLFYIQTCWLHLGVWCMVVLMLDGDSLILLDVMKIVSYCLDFSLYLTAKAVSVPATSKHVSVSCNMLLTLWERNLLLLHQLICFLFFILCNDASSDNVVQNFMVTNSHRLEVNGRIRPWGNLR